MELGCGGRQVDRRGPAAKARIIDGPTRRLVLGAWPLQLVGCVKACAGNFEAVAVRGVAVPVDLARALERQQQRRVSLVVIVAHLLRLDRAHLLVPILLERLLRIGRRDAGEGGFDLQRFVAAKYLLDRPRAIFGRARRRVDIDDGDRLRIR